MDRCHPLVLRCNLNSHVVLELAPGFVLSRVLYQVLKLDPIDCDEWGETPFGDSELILDRQITKVLM
jgi:hypothetical protein